MCLAGTVVASWSLTQKVAGSNPFTLMIEFSENIWGKLKCSFISVPLGKHVYWTSLQSDWCNIEALVNNNQTTVSHKSCLITCLGCMVRSTRLFRGDGWKLSVVVAAAFTSSLKSGFQTCVRNTVFLTAGLLLPSRIFICLLFFSILPFCHISRFSPYKKH